MIKVFPKYLARAIHTTNISNGIGSTMQKIMKQPKKRKPFFEEQPILPHSSTFGKDLLTSKHKGSKRRINVLNKLFMRYITDLMATGEMSSVYAGLGLEINRVEVTPDYKGLNVFWIAKESPKDRDIEDMLTQTSKQLRSELSRLRVVGNVPKIHFIKDKQYAEIIEIDNRLAKADFGEDYEPVEVIQKLRTRLMITTTLPPNLKEQIRKLEQDEPEEVEYDIPDMPQDVLGLNHKEIMNRIKASINKSHIKPKMEALNDSLVRTVNTQPVEFKTAKLQREAFKQFLMERQILKRKLRRQYAKERSGLDYFEDDYLELRERELDMLKPVSIEDKDYIDEDIEDFEGNKK